jgi:hypothetical protein
MEDATSQAVAEVGDVIQLDPEQSEWGPIVMVVDKVNRYVARAYSLMPVDRLAPPGRFYVRVSHGNYAIVGKATWLCADDIESGHG